MWKIVQLLPQCDFRTFPSIQGEAYVHLQSLPILNLSPATSTLFSVSIDLPFLDLLHKLYYIIHGFCVWFFSPSIMFLSFIHVATCVNISLFVHCYVVFQFKGIYCIHSRGLFPPVGSGEQGCCGPSRLCVDILFSLLSANP